MALASASAPAFASPLVSSASPSASSLGSSEPSSDSSKSSSSSGLVLACCGGGGGGRPCCLAWAWARSAKASASASAVVFASTSASAFALASAASAAPPASASVFPVSARLTKFAGKLPSSPFASCRPVHHPSRSRKPIRESPWANIKSPSWLPSKSCNAISRTSPPPAAACTCLTS